ncbi:hypothetical protein E1B28_010733 [Marasmius oreades]|uniref:Macrofage activating glycoprotein n=1 Tax=Marasmius oreades TaxID=181124 RepID=A0A9P7RSV0_9AGAR|nr:uncharacterized protein E1B28_010733 [Marasmius oreades]KAG7089022.1 hypothetical protein E1B28_010733 [Marasmius oreades]
MPQVAIPPIVVVAALAVSLAVAQSTFPATPLVSKRFSYPTGIPYKADTDVGLIRGEQSGYNICNSTTEGQNSLCQTGFINGLDDFCLWAPSKANSTIADTEGEEVAWCTKPGRGTRLIPSGALQGVQFMKTPDYIQVVGYLNQSLINMQDGDFGGELDPHGADLRGNPMGGLLYTQQFNTPSGQWTQVIEWHNFMGGERFCFKACDPAGAHAADFCQHIFDRIGCAYNAPNNATQGVFESCLGDNQDFPGIYTVNGQVMTYTQPPEEAGPIPPLPYQPRVPPSSSCTQFDSAKLYPVQTATSATSTNNQPSGTQSGAGGSQGTQGSNGGRRAGVSELIGMTSVSFVGVFFSMLFFS